jgi:hypothetical protein
MANRIYCSYFDHNYLSRGLALYHSLQRHAPGSRLWVLCLSEACHEALVALGLPDLVPVKLADFETADPEVAATRSNRSVIEYYFTCSPAWLLYVMDREPSPGWVTYLDGDLFFFDSPEAIFDELEESAVAIIPHRYTPALLRLQKFGAYNVGWVGARNDSDGLAAIKWWRSKCIEWCYDYVDGERFADQGYLGALPKLFPRVKPIENVGANLAPWNIGNYRIEYCDNKVLIDSVHPLIFFHYQGLRKALGWFIFNSHRRYRAPFSRNVRNHIYRPYIDRLLEIERSTGPILNVSEGIPLQRSKTLDVRNYIKDTARGVRSRVFQLLDIVTGCAFLVIRGKAY